MTGSKTANIKNFLKQAWFWIKLILILLLFVGAFYLVRFIGKGLSRFLRGKCIEGIDKIEELKKEKQEIKKQYVTKKDLKHYTRSQSLEYIRSVLKRRHE